MKLAKSMMLTMPLLLAACGESGTDVPATEAVATEKSANDMAANEEGVAMDAGAEATPTAAASDTPDEPDEPDDVADNPKLTPSPTASASPKATPAPKASPSPAKAAEPVAAAGPPPAFGQCKACHAVEPGRNGIGPTLAGMVGRKAGTVPGFNYTPALKGADITWNRANLDEWLAAPTKKVPGTRMVLGVSDAAKRKAIIDYMATLK